MFTYTDRLIQAIDSLYDCFLACLFRNLSFGTFVRNLKLSTSFYLAWYIVGCFGHCIVCPLIHCFWLSLWFTASDYPFDLRLLITPSIYGFWLLHWFTASDFSFDLRLLITPLIYGFWLPLRFTTSDYSFDLRLLIDNLRCVRGLIRYWVYCVLGVL